MSKKIDKIYPKLRPIDSIGCKELSGDVFKICILTVFDDSGQMETSHFPYKEISIITRNIIGL